MQLLVSVRNRTEALAAVAGGASIVDAKDPAAGPLGRVTLDEWRAIVDAVREAGAGRSRGACPISAALGEADDEGAVEGRARSFASAGAAFVKLGFAGTSDEWRVRALTAAAIRGAVPARARVTGVAYADYRRVGALDPDTTVSALAAAGAHGVLLDTADKAGPGVLQLMAPAALRAWLDRARAAGMFTAVAGQLRLEDLATVDTCGADIAGVRGAACEGGRRGVIRATRVRALAQSMMRGSLLDSLPR
jgi:uncharacterized protein (UPF0264 family)